MTNYRKAISGAAHRPFNKKDGCLRSQSRSQASQYEAEGFEQIDWNKWSYTWQGDFPTFILAPGILEGKAGLAATFSPEIRVYFPYGTAPSEIKAQLDDKILEIMRYDAEVADEQPLSQDWLDF